MASSWALKRLAAQTLLSYSLRRPHRPDIASPRLFSSVPAGSQEDFLPLDVVFEPVMIKKDDGMEIKLSLPGFSKEHMKVSVELNELVIEGSCPVVHRLTEKIQIPDYVSYSKTNPNIKATMKNGLLQVTFPNPNSSTDEKKNTDVCSIPIKVE